MQQISVRPGSDEQVPLNEAVSLAMMDVSDQPTERHAFASVKVNNRPSVARLLVENPSKSYADNAVGSNGVLYKSLSTGSFAYRGDDPTEYEKDFKQLTKKGSQDLQPIMNLVKWAEKASDKEFAAELADHIDVESFAEYVATQNLLLNFDDMSGPGKNYYLWYDLGTKKFTVLGWDFNLTLNGSATAGPDDQIGMGMGGAAAPAAGPEPGPAGPESAARPAGPDPEAGSDPEAGARREERQGRPRRHVRSRP
ncbi:CotH kinase family protein [Streptomyces sp. M19]